MVIFDRGGKKVFEKQNVRVNHPLSGRAGLVNETPVIILQRLFI